MTENKFKERKEKQKESAEVVKINQAKIESPEVIKRKIEQMPQEVGADVVDTETKIKKEIEPIVNLPVDKITNLEKKEREKKIEKILEKNLDEIYISLPPDKQQEFKIAGEQAAQEINNLLDKAKVKIKQIIIIIKKWLSLLPGVNQFFLEQEAKIKADEIIRLKEKDEQ